MLVLTRKINESIFIGGRGIEVMILDIRGDKVRLGIEAPKWLSVHRAEVLDDIEREQLQKLKDEGISK